MSLYDRDYYRDDAERAMPALSQAQGLSITAWLIIANSCVFAFTLVSDGFRDRMLADFIRQYFYLWPDGVLGRFRVWQLLTATFIHAGFIHILFNMWFLYMFGRVLEEIIGRRDFLAFYLAAGLLGSVCYVAWAAISGTPAPSVGASGSVVGVVVLYAFFRPRQLIYVWGVIPLQVRWLAILFVGTDLLLLFESKNSDVAHCAHLGGALFAVLYRYVDLRIARVLSLFGGFKRGKSMPQPLTGERILDEPFGPRMPEYGDMDAVERRVDDLLNKISKNGIASLSDEEREFLKDASRRYRRR